MFNLTQILDAFRGALHDDARGPGAHGAQARERFDSELDLAAAAHAADDAGRPVDLSGTATGHVAVVADPPTAPLPEPLPVPGTALESIPGIAPPIADESTEPAVPYHPVAEFGKQVAIAPGSDPVESPLPVPTPEPLPGTSGDETTALNDVPGRVTDGRPRRIVRTVEGKTIQSGRAESSTPSESVRPVPVPRAGAPEPAVDPAARPHPFMTDRGARVATSEAARDSSPRTADDPRIDGGARPVDDPAAGDRPGPQFNPRIPERPAAPPRAESGPSRPALPHVHHEPIEPRDGLPPRVRPGIEGTPKPGLDALRAEEPRGEADPVRRPAPIEPGETDDTTSPRDPGTDGIRADASARTFVRIATPPVSRDVPGRPLPPAPETDTAPFDTRLRDGSREAVEQRDLPRERPDEAATRVPFDARVTRPTRAEIPRQSVEAQTEAVDSDGRTAAEGEPSPPRQAPAQAQSRDVDFELRSARSLSEIRAVLRAAVQPSVERGPTSLPQPVTPDGGAARVDAPEPALRSQDPSAGSRPVTVPETSDLELEPFVEPAADEGLDAGATTARTADGRTRAAGDPSIAVAAKPVPLAPAASGGPSVIQAVGSSAGAGGEVQETGAEPIRVHHEALAEAIVARARALQRDGRVEVRFALDPEDLGPVHVRIESRGDRIRIRILASSGQAVDVLGSSVTRLAAQIEQAGFRDPRIDLALDQPSHHGGGPRHEHPARRGAGDRPESPRRSVTPLSNPLGYGSGSNVRLDRTA